MNAICSIKVEVEIPCGHYGNEWQLEDILKQARTEAVEKTRIALGKITSATPKVTGHRVILTDETTY